MNNICVCYSSDENGVDLFCVSLYSLLTYRNSDTFINCYLLHQHISIKAQNKIKLIVSKFKNVKFEFIDCSIYEEEYQIKDIKKHDLRLQWPAPMYYYLLLPKVLNTNEVSKIIYLDIDAFVISDITELYKMRNTSVFAGVKEAVIISWIVWQNSHSEEEIKKCMPDFKYYSYFRDKNPLRYTNMINSGVILINLIKLKEYDLHDVFKYALDNNLPDQDLINKYFDKQIENISCKWNFAVHYFIDTNICQNVTSMYDNTLNLLNIKENDVANFTEYAKIIHLSTRPKPTFFFNEETKPIIEKLGGLGQYVNLYVTIYKNKNNFNYQNYKLTKMEYELLKEKMPPWINFYAYSEKHRTFEKCFLCWARIWEKMNKEIDFNA